MTDLRNMTCVACQLGAPRATDEEISEYTKLLPEWNVVETDGIKRLERVSKFKNFIQALEFTNKIGTLAEELGHHPAILTEWGQVTVTLWTHKIKGLHRNDFVMAAKISEIGTEI